ncbi:hypothetical protein E2562_034906 [Oryza meyeriana var. granulata]|uniref:Uncharacterized protein n=1 Tax=Oryza meyeriana var. granulata TaxID=110450 RepID=A0A6G1E7M1_9ORYZ|nr:hypothetical protein E2562_034906 [Oryza meyeriana var. granulata]
MVVHGTMTATQLQHGGDMAWSGRAPGFAARAFPGRFWWQGDSGRRWETEAATDGPGERSQRTGNSVTTTRLTSRGDKGKIEVSASSPAATEDAKAWVTAGEARWEEAAHGAQGHGAQPVSYTHLDVYKRHAQGHGAQQGRRLARGGGGVGAVAGDDCPVMAARGRAGLRWHGPRGYRRRRRAVGGAARGKEAQASTVWERAAWTGSRAAQRQASSAWAEGSGNGLAQAGGARE